MKLQGKGFALLLGLTLASASPMSWAAESAEHPSTAEARRFTDVFASVAERVGPSVVQIDVAVKDTSSATLRWYRGVPSVETPIRRGMGSGVIFSPTGHILTNNHVIEGALAINVRLNDGRLLPAKLIGRDLATDLAVLKVEATGLPAARFADSDRARVGEWVVAIGSPFGLGHTVTTGVLSAKGRGGLGVNAIEDYLQTDASINPGNSGGPLVALDGSVLGINTMIVGRGQGIGFAVPSNMARRVVMQLMKTGRVQRAWIGVGLQDVTPEIAAELNTTAGSGALINSVTQGGPAHRANLQPGDIVATVAGKPIRDAQELTREVLNHDVGQTVRLEVVRAGKRYVTDLQLQARSEPLPPLLPMQQATPASSGLGLQVRNVVMTPARAGVEPSAVAQVIGVLPGSAADRAGLRPQDLIVQADNVSMPNAEQVAKALEDGRALLLVRRGNTAFFAALRR